LIDVIENRKNKPYVRAVSDAEEIKRIKIKRKQSIPGEDACDSGLSTQE
jgi:hypothetical protein